MGVYVGACIGAYVGECVGMCVHQRARMHVCNFACLSEMRMSEFVHVHVYVCLDAYWTK